MSDQHGDQFDDEEAERRFMAEYRARRAEHVLNANRVLFLLLGIGIGIGIGIYWL